MKAMEVLKIMFIITMTIAFSIAFALKTYEKSTMTTNTKIAIKTPILVIRKKGEEAATITKLLPSKSLSRFLVEKAKTARSANHCQKNKKMCETMYGKGWECCNNKCVDLRSDKQNCGGCKKKCKYMGECCRGQCVDVAYDKRHCGRCNNPCQRGKYCVYGMCEYA